MVHGLFLLIPLQSVFSTILVFSNEILLFISLCVPCVHYAPQASL